jgi:hypothetical protein
MPLRAQRWLEIGAGVGIDFHADGNLDDARGFPSHGRFSLEVEARQ